MSERCPSELIFAGRSGKVRLKRSGINSNNRTDYSIQNTTRPALFLPTSREPKYKAKAAIDGLFVRLDDVLQGGIVYAGTTLGLGLSGLAALNPGFTLMCSGCSRACQGVSEALESRAPCARTRL